MAEKIRLNTVEVETQTDETLHYRFIRDYLLETSKTDPAKALNLILVTSENPNIADAATVCFASRLPLNWKGREYIDNISQEARMGECRSGLFVSPYTLPTISAVITYYCIDATGEIHLALIHNKRRHSDWQAGDLPNHFEVPAGYMKVISAINGEKGVSRLPREYRDQAETLLSKNTNAYREASALYRIEHSISADAILPLQKEPYDKSIRECAIAEGCEEAGPEPRARMNKEYCFFVGMEDEGRLNELGRMFNPHFFYAMPLQLVNGELPLLDPEDKDEIIGAYWVKASEIEKQENGQIFVSFKNQKIPLFQPFSQKIEEAIAMVRDQQFSAFSEDKFPTRQAYLRCLENFNLTSPILSRAEFGKTAQKSYEELCTSYREFEKIRKAFLEFSIYRQDKCSEHDVGETLENPVGSRQKMSHQ